MKPSQLRKDHRSVNCKTQVQHFAIGNWHRHFTPEDQKETTLCGKTARKISATFVKNHVSCPLCKEELIKNNWYCPTHKFITEKEVTFEEKCSFCGQSVFVNSLGEK